MRLLPQPPRLVLGPLEIEHIVPRAKRGSDAISNLWLSCRLCNNYKGTRIDGLDPRSGRRDRLYNPRRQRWSDHFKWSDDGLKIVGLTPRGRATAIAFQLNNVIAVLVRAEWIAAGWHPPR
jgi:hypothetical protein